mgnify:CR=1 FL=1
MTCRNVLNILMVKANSLVLLFVVMLASVFVSGCYMDTHVVTNEYYRWTFIGVKDDSTAVVEVTLVESGYIDCHHFMGYHDDNFSRDVSTRFYEVRMDSLKRGSARSSSDELAKNAVSSVDFIWLDENDHDCGFILMKGGTVRDTLEIGNCNTESTATIMGNYLNYNGNLYNIVDGKIQSHRPKYKVSNKDGNIIFEDAKGNQVIYGGEP